jgi:uncharacterized protein YjbI with pentapeptide repeats
MYKLIKDKLTGETKTVQRLSDAAFIPFDPANTDYANFKKQVLDGAELQDADGKPMQDAVQFVKELP